MTPRDWLEASWHLALLVLVLPPVLRVLLRRRWVRILMVVVVLAALGYHVTVVEDCHAYLLHRGAGRLCTWNV